MRPDYSDNDPKGWCGDPARGAALGRDPRHADDTNAPVKLYLRKVRLNGGGYDANGTYFGATRWSDVYWYADASGEVDGTCRAGSRTLAKEQITALYTSATFYR